jgi:predicted helicase
MAALLNLKPTHRAVSGYYLALAQLSNVGAKHESAVRSAFDQLIEACAGPLKWTLVREYAVTRKGAAPLRLDAVLLDSYRIPHGVIEAKDDGDDLAVEVRSKLKLGYPAKNTLFWQPKRLLLVQDGTGARDLPLTGADGHPLPGNLVEVLSVFFNYTEPVIADWERATEEFRERVAELGRSVREVIQRARGTVGFVPNKKFAAAFNVFTTLCRTAINPTLSVEAVEEMLIQHLLTARLFGTVFSNPEFTRRNVVAVEIEKVIDALASGHFDRADFLGKLDRFYLAIENAARTIDDFSEKQKFLNTVYEKFFQGFAVKVADTMGIVYTPPSIVRFIIASIREILRTEFGRDLGDAGVHFLDPFTGTGNFLVHLMRELPKAALPRKYAGELWANEIMLLPYYIACLNVEHEYFERTGTYESFPGLCLVDTFDLAEPREQTEMSFMYAENTERVNRQKKAPIFVILGNPPYNANQQDENDNNKNRKYPQLDQRIRNTYAADSAATLLNKLSDPYIKALRWATDRVGEDGIVAYVTNNGYLDGIATDGVRKHLAEDFDAIYLVDLNGNVRKNPKLSGTTHNVFGIQVGVSIALFVRHKQKELKPRKAVIRYATVGADWRKERKWAWLEEKRHIGGVKWRKLVPDERYTWLHDEESAGFSKFLPIGTKETKAVDSLDAHAIFRTYSLGVSTNRDAVVYDFDRDRLAKRVEQFCEDYNAEVARWHRKGRPLDIDGFVRADRVKWSRDLKQELMAQRFFSFDTKYIRGALYRPFSRRWLYRAPGIVDRVGEDYFPGCHPLAENRALIAPGPGNRQPFGSLVCDLISSLDFAFEKAQFFPLYTYDADGGHRRDNVTDWALGQFQANYPKAKVTKRDIFHYVYAVLHHPVYREKFAANLRRELPRIPFAPDFERYAEVGEKLATLHVGYESQKEYPLKRVETPGSKLDLRVERMKLSKDKTALAYNGYLTLEGIPREVFEYRIGNRSALEWVIDQYRVERDKTDAEKIVSDPNRSDDEEYILRLVGQVVAVSIETVKLVRSLGKLPLPGQLPDSLQPKPAPQLERGYTQAELDAAHVYFAKEDPPKE